MATMNFTMFEGDTHTLEVTVRDDAGDVVDITGVVIRWWLAKSNKATGDAIYVEKETGDGITIVDGPAGRFDVLIEPEDTEGRGGKTYYHEAEIDDSGVISTVLVGVGVITLTLIP
jgi:hypothetical protein